MKVLFVGLYPYGMAPSQKFRIDQFVPLWRERGIDFIYSGLLTEKEYVLYRRSGQALLRSKIFVMQTFRRLKDIINAGRADIVFVHREATFLPVPWLELMIYKRAKRVIYDIDDAIWLPQPDGLIQRHKKVPVLVRNADIVIAGNKHIKDHIIQSGWHKDVRIIPSVVDTEKYVPPDQDRNAERGVLRIGWTGSPSTFKTAFMPFVKVWRRLLKNPNIKVEFHIMGAGEYKELFPEGIYYDYDPSQEVPFLHNVDVGIVPIPEGPWMKYKNNIKLFMYMATGLPVVASRIGINEDVLKGGNCGFLASTADQWYEALSRLGEDEALRQQMGMMGRQQVERKYSVKAWVDKYVELFREAT
ncbi:MAG: glycosyltransferase family 4 protein [Chlorobi bacterium]|nr:glycosyltransferase family 4 protein [Chlorobiota bacterium]